MHEQLDTQYVPTLWWLINLVFSPVLPVCVFLSLSSLSCVCATHMGV